ncbi:PREDICTED: uncharacterized protein LOC105141889 isoform X5 [Populus euphratica]|uniref:non-specific serine/threonine protein kinase n=1 Tax=Populus euphratica TaxID=75702 RepID=A0AAJ6YA12_POPEU|nr:PREDICTED: uncharacterized protein LOC105141889 isoform X5 [Populus euphratica]
MQTQLCNTQVALIDSLTTTTESDLQEKAWHILALLLSIGNPTPAPDLASHCTLFNASPDLIESLCSISNSPITLTSSYDNSSDNFLVTISPLGLFALNQFLSNFNLIEAFATRIWHAICGLEVPLEDLVRMYFRKRKRIGFDYAGVYDKDQEVCPLPKRIRNDCWKAKVSTTELCVPPKKLKDSKPSTKIRVTTGVAASPRQQALCQSIEQKKAVNPPKENQRRRKDHMKISMGQKSKQTCNDIHTKERKNDCALNSPKDRVGSKDFPCFDSYIVEEEGGSGGYGTVYRATRKLDGTTVAIKCPHENAHRHHVSNELRMLERFGGKNCVIKFEGCLKNQNSDCFVLEYVEHDRPEVLKKEIDVFQLRWYGHCMFRALASLHKQGVVHRDIKPGNFLFSCKANKGYLIDFNLALDLHQKLGTINKSKAANDVSFNSVAASNAKYVPPSKSRRFPGGKFLDAVDLGAIKDFKSTLEAKNVKKKAVRNIMISQGADGSVVTSVKDATSARTPSAERMKEPLPSQGRKELISLLHEAMQSPNQEASSFPASMRKRIAAPPGKLDGRHIYLTPMPLHSTGITVAGIGLVKNKCGDGKNKKEGPCVGTKGFRAPEVLLRSLHQGPKVDIWSAGVTLLYLIIGKTPFYGDPEQNIKDIAKLRGSEDLWEVSKLHNRESSFPADLYNMQSLPPTTLWEWCKLNSKRQDFLDAVPSSLIDLVDKCLTVNPRLRISAEDALKHEFFAPCNESLRRQKLIRQGHSLDPRTKTPSHGQGVARPIKISQRQP